MFFPSVGLSVAQGVMGAGANSRLLGLPLSSDLGTRGEGLGRHGSRSNDNADSELWLDEVSSNQVGAIVTGVGSCP
jgi:hypothetical protein